MMFVIKYAIPISDTELGIAYFNCGKIVVEIVFVFVRPAVIPGQRHRRPAQENLQTAGNAH